MLKLCSYDSYEITRAFVFPTEVPVPKYHCS